MCIAENGGNSRALGRGRINGNGGLQTLKANTWTKVYGVFTTPSDWESGASGSLMPIPQNFFQI